MSIKPVDVGVIVQRMAEVDRAQQVRDQRAVVAQQQFGQEMRAELERRETEVKGPPEAARLAVDPDAEQGRQNGNSRPGADERRGKGQGPTGRKDSGPKPCGPGQNLDIKV